MDKDPHFIIVGAAKAGTTAMVRILEQNPKIYFSPIKEPNYFCTDIRLEDLSEDYRKNNMTELNDYFNHSPLAKLQLAFVRDSANYQQLFDAANDQITGEASTSYLYSTSAAQEISKHNPDTKIIAILREPIKRAYSHYIMASKLGYVTCDFETAIRNDQRKQDKGFGRSELFIEMGLYAEQLQRYYDTFPAENIKVILYDDFRNRPDEVMKELTSFLGLEDFAYDTSIEANTGSVPRFKGLNRILFKLGLRNRFTAAVPPKMKDKLKSMYLKDDNGIEMSDSLKKELQSLYRQDIAKLESLTGIDLTSWKEF